MRIVIVGAGNVGRSIARELTAHGHQILLIDKNPKAMKPDTVPEAEWLCADACELATLEEARIDNCDIAISATGDDKVNLVHSLLAKTEFGVPRTVARVNHPGNEWMFDQVWGVDVAVSTPRLMAALVEEAITVGELVRLFTFQKGRANLVELTLPDNSPESVIVFETSRCQETQFWSPLSAMGKAERPNVRPRWRLAMSCSL
ncbi:Trk system potassium uptake protein TrkA [Cutibacterium acnes JCM 18918]|nr:Trk system potassium uptake protein TrkA [Cutibacterium acnes JCM 18918]